MRNPGALLTLVRSKKPVIHHIMNQVTMSFVANGILAMGGRPMMARHPVESAEAVRKADALVLNLGTPEPEIVDSMLAAGHTAQEHQIPIVFDPVGVGLSRFRQKAAEQILHELRPSAICGNAAELAFLLHPTWLGRGIDATSPQENSVEIALEVSRRFGTIAILTGKTDVITDGQLIGVNESGDEWMTRITGTGCLATALAALFLAVIPSKPPEPAQSPKPTHETDGQFAFHDRWEAAAAAVCTLGIAGEQARLQAAGPGSFEPALLDALYGLDADTLNSRARLRLLS